ncbi:uncharacterized protein LOC141902257 [Tubulanus polymorphus]|uniref:uncharacterized protein LOC141902257 n=1 Tax=Tubulanus polymorphus TaxID=672921 RepID=UPI003DA5BECE
MDSGHEDDHSDICIKQNEIDGSKMSMLVCEDPQQQEGIGLMNCCEDLQQLQSSQIPRPLDTAAPCQDQTDIATSQDTNDTVALCQDTPTADVTRLQQRNETLLLEMRNRERQFHEIICGKNKTLDQLQKTVYSLESTVENLQRDIKKYESNQREKSVVDLELDLTQKLDEALAEHLSKLRTEKQMEIKDDLNVKMEKLEVDLYRNVDQLVRADMSLMICRNRFEAELSNNTDLNNKLKHVEEVLNDARHRENEVHDLLNVELENVRYLETERDEMVKEIEVLKDKLREALVANKDIEELMAQNQIYNVEDRHNVNTLKQTIAERDERIKQFFVKQDEWKVDEKYLMDKIIDAETELKVELEKGAHHAALKHEFEQKISILSQELDIAISNRLEENARCEKLKILEEKDGFSLTRIENLTVQLNNLQTELQKVIAERSTIENSFEEERQGLIFQIKSLEEEAKSEKELVESLNKEKRDMKEILASCRIELARVQCELRRSQELRADERRLFEKHECENKLLKQRLKEEQHNFEKTVQEKAALEKRIISLNTKYMYGLNRSSSIRSACFKMAPGSTEILRACDTNDIGHSWCVIDMDNMSVNSMNISRSSDRRNLSMTSYMSVQPDRSYKSDLHISGVSDIRLTSPYSIISQSDNYINNNKDISHGPLTSSHLDQTSSIPHGIGNLFSCEDEPLHVDYEWDQLSVLKDTNTVIKKPQAKKVKKYESVADKKDVLSKSWHNISLNSQKDKDVFKKPFSKRTPRQKPTQNQENLPPPKDKNANTSNSVDFKTKHSIMKAKRLRAKRLFFRS